MIDVQFRWKRCCNSGAQAAVNVFWESRKLSTYIIVISCVVEVCTRRLHTMNLTEVLTYFVTSYRYTEIIEVITCKKRSLKRK